jgi:ribosomal protein S27E
VRILCRNCGRENDIPSGRDPTEFQCWQCGRPLPPASSKGGETSTAVGLVGGALLGAAIAGPVGAIIGGIFGALVGNQAKGAG